MPKLLTVILICLFALNAAGCQLNRHNYQVVFAETEHPLAAEQPDSKSHPVRVAISSVLAPTDTINHYRKIAAYLGEKLNRPTILIQRKSYSEISTLMINGGADIAFLSSGAYLTYGHVDGIDPLVLQERMGVPYYKGYIIVHRDSDFRNINDLQGRTIAFSDPTSYSGYIFVNKALADFDETPERFFGRHIYTYSHNKSLRAVAGKIVDAAAIDDLVYEHAKIKSPEVADSVKIIATSAAVGTGPVVVSNSLSANEKRTVKDLLLTMHTQEQLKPALQGLLIDRFVPFDPKLYDIDYSAGSKRGHR